MDPEFTLTKTDELEMSVFIDADHGHAKVSGRSVTGVIVVVGSTPVCWSSKHQTSVQTSTFGAEFAALKTAVKVAVDIRR